MTGDEKNISDRYGGLGADHWGLQRDRTGDNAGPETLADASRLKFYEAPLHTL
jgi:hypothetical protein